MSRTALGAFALLLIAILPFAGGAYQPAPGGLMVANHLTSDNNGGCTGAVQMSYGFLPEQDTRSFDFTVTPNCDVEVTKRVSVNHGPWGPVGEFHVQVDIISRYEDAQRHTMHQSYEYPLMGCSQGGIAAGVPTVNQVPGWTEGAGVNEVNSCEVRTTGGWSRPIVGSVLLIYAHADAFGWGPECSWSWNTPADNAAHPSGSCATGAPPTTAYVWSEVVEYVGNVASNEIAHFVVGAN